jgi:hypothetical protein
MAKDRERIDLRGDPDWIARIRAQAGRLGLGLSAYIRLAVTKQLERDEADEKDLRLSRRRSGS